MSKKKTESKADNKSAVQEPACDSNDLEIVSYKIHPGLGIARIGNSPSDFFVGPLAPGEVPNPEGGFKDKMGRIKRQAAQFRVFGYNKHGVAVREITADDADIQWSVHLANRKAEHFQFVGRWWESQFPEWYAVNPKHPPLRNQEVLDPAMRAKTLVIDPGPREIKGRCAKGDNYRFDSGTFGPLKYTVVSLGDMDNQFACNAINIKGSRTGYINQIYDTPNLNNVPMLNGQPDLAVAQLWAQYPDQVIEPSAMSPQVQVPLGELQTDEKGRLLVLGGLGKSDSVMPLNEIGLLNTVNYYANNDYWYDDTSDGPVRATVTLKNGVSVEAESAWVLVVPPKYSVAARGLTTLYEVAQEAWSKKCGHTPGHRQPSFTRDIYPLFERLQQYPWLNAAANRGHGPGPGKAGHFLDAQNQPQEWLYTKGAQFSAMKQHVLERLRPPDLLGEPSPTSADTAESLKYASSKFMPQMSGDGGDAIVPQDNSNQSPIAGVGSTYITWLTLSPTQYHDFTMWAQDQFDDDWSGSAPPFVPIGSFPVTEQPAMIDKGALDACVGAACYPGIEMTFISTDPDTWSALCRLDASRLRPGDITCWMALPWQADFSECNTNWWPAARPDDVVPEAEYEQILANYNGSMEGGLEAVLANRVPWSRGIPNESPQLDNAMIHAWKDFGFVVPRKYPSTGEDAQIVYIETDRCPYAAVTIRDAFYYLMNIANYGDFLPKAHEMVLGMLKEAWFNQEVMGDPDQVWKFFPFTQDAFDARMQLVYNNYVRDNQDQAIFASDLLQTRDQVINGILQFAPFNQLDGAWLSHITPDGPLANINEMLFRIRMDELGDGNVGQNHANVYTATLQSVGLYLPDLHTRAYADNPQLLDSSFTQAVFLLAIAQFDDEFFPELLGMTLELEWGSVSLPTGSRRLSAFGITPLYYDLHIGIDNASVGHGAIAKKAVEMYLEMVRQQQGETAMQTAWKRIWNGYVAFGTLGTLGQDLAELPSQQDQGSSALWNQMAAMITSKAPYASLMHGDIMIGENRLNDWFEDPFGLLVALQQAGYIIPGDLASPMFRLMSFNGPMYHVFNPEEMELWRQWTLSLTAGNSATLPVSLGIYEDMRVVVDMLRARQQGVAGHRVQLQGPDPDQPGQTILKPLCWWFNLGANLVGTDAEIKKQLRKADDALLATLATPENGWIINADVLRSPIITAMATGFGDMAGAFREIAPGTSGKTYLACLVNWIEAGCPIGAAGQKGLSLAATSGDKKRPRRFPWGMGRVH